MCLRTQPIRQRALARATDRDRPEEERRARSTPTRCRRSAPPSRAGTSRRRSRSSASSSSVAACVTLVASRVIVASGAISQSFVRSTCACRVWHGRLRIWNRSNCPGLGARATRRGRGRRPRRAQLSPVAGQPGPAPAPGRRVDVDARARADRQGREPGACDVAAADDRFELDTDAGYGAGLLARLDRFKIRVKADDLVASRPTWTRRRATSRTDRARLAGDGARDRAGRDRPAGHRAGPHRGQLHEGLLSRARSWSSGWTAGAPRHRGRCAGSTCRRDRRRATRCATAIKTVGEITTVVLTRGARLGQAFESASARPSSSDAVSDVSSRARPR